MPTAGNADLRLAALQAQNQTGPIAGGNAYSLAFDGDGVEAIFDYGDPNEDVELMSVDDFRSILEGWRAAVTRVTSHASRCGSTFRERAAR